MLTLAAAMTCSTLLAHKVPDILGQPHDLCAHAGKVVLVVNVASQCGYTPQYKGLQALHERYKSRGLVILGFPANDFGQQEPGTNAEIAEFCDRTYAVKFDMLGKTSVAPGGSAFFDGLAQASGERPKWNFHKYLIGRDGKVAGQYSSMTRPDDPALLKTLEQQLASR